MTRLLNFQRYLLELNKTIHAYLIYALIVYTESNELIDCEGWYNDQFLECVINRDDADITHTNYYTQHTINRAYVYNLIRYINVYYSAHYGEENILDWKNLSDELIMNRYTYAYVRQNIQYSEFKQMLKDELPFMKCINKEDIYTALNIGRMPQIVVDNNKDLEQGIVCLILIIIMFFINYLKDKL